MISILPRGYILPLLWGPIWFLFCFVVMLLLLWGPILLLFCFLVMLPLLWGAIWFLFFIVVISPLLWGPIWFLVCFVVILPLLWGHIWFLFCFLVILPLLRGPIWFLFCFVVTLPLPWGPIWFQFCFVIRNNHFFEDPHDFYFASWLHFTTSLRTHMISIFHRRHINTSFRAHMISILFRGYDITSLRIHMIYILFRGYITTSSKTRMIFTLFPDCIIISLRTHMIFLSFRGFITTSITRWGRETHICVSKLTIIGSDNGLSPDRRQAIIWTYAGLLLTGPLGTNFSDILIKIYTFSFKKMHLKMSSGKWRPFCLGLKVLRTHVTQSTIFFNCCLTGTRAITTPPVP